MLWRVRTTLPDRPGALAVLAGACGEAGVNILGLQVFPGVERVTDELVLRTPEDWDLPEIAGLVERSGGTSVSVMPCTEAALTDQPTRFVQAARTIVSQPASFPEMVARLFDAEADPTDALAPVQDVLELAVGDLLVQIRRTAPFTATEHARAAALAGLVTDVLGGEDSRTQLPAPGDHITTSVQPEYSKDRDGLVALVEGVVVGRAVLGPVIGETGCALEISVDASWRRRGIGTRLLVEATRLAGEAGASEVVLTTHVDNQAVLPLVLGSGLRSRMRMSAATLTVRVPVRDRMASRR